MLKLGRDKNPESSKKIAFANDDWTIFPTQLGGDQLVVKLCITPGLENTSQATAAIVQVALLNPDEMGFNDAQEGEQLANIEAALTSALAKPSDTTYVMSQINCGVKQWLFYTRDQEAFNERYLALKQKSLTHDLGIQLLPDADWKVYEIFTSLWAQYEANASQQESTPDEQPQDELFIDNADLWQGFLNMGVTENTPVELKFEFYFASKEKAQFLGSLLKAQKMKVSVTKERSYIVLVGYKLKATTAKQLWTLDKLNKQAAQMIELTKREEIGGILEHIGAYGPKALVSV
jgi:Family of unknown function (DUF695)